MDDKGVWSGERPGGEARPVEEARVERDERAVRELVLEDLEVGARRVPLELDEVGLDVLVERDELRAQTWCSVCSWTFFCSGGDDLLGERQVVLALEVLADLVDVRLRVVLRVLVFIEL